MVPSMRIRTRGNALAPPPPPTQPGHMGHFIHSAGRWHADAQLNRGNHRLHSLTLTGDSSCACTFYNTVPIDPPCGGVAAAGGWQSYGPSTPLD